VCQASDAKALKNLLLLFRVPQAATTDVCTGYQSTVTSTGVEVTCDSAGRVTSLGLYGIMLGSVGANLASNANFQALTHLERLVILPAAPTGGTSANVQLSGTLSLPNQLPALKFLWVSGHLLTSIQLPKVAALEVLLLGGNTLSASLDLSALTKLRVVDLSGFKPAGPSVVTFPSGFPCLDCELIYPDDVTLPVLVDNTGRSLLTNDDVMFAPRLSAAAISVASQTVLASLIPALKMSPTDIITALRKIDLRLKCMAKKNGEINTWHRIAPEAYIYSLALNTLPETQSRTFVLYKSTTVQVNIEELGNYKNEWRYLI
jgi:hypothetical protein